MSKTSVAAIALAGLLSAPAVHAVNLLEVLEQALRSDPLLREAEANREAAFEAKPQALSQLLPQFSGSVNGDLEDSKGLSTFSQVDVNTGVIVNVSNNFEQDARRTDWTLQLQQTVFRWDQWVALKQADKTVAQAEADYQAALQDLLLRASQRYFDVLAAQDTLEAEQAAREAIGRQLEQAQKRFEVGLIAITDVQEAQAGYDAAVAAEIAAKRGLATAREFLREITGEYFEQLAIPGSGMPLVSPDPVDEEAWVMTSLDQNVSLISARLGAEIAREEIRIRRAGRYPTIDLVASRFDRNLDADRSNFLSVDPDPDFTKRPADQDFRVDTLSLQFNVPFYTGGFNSSRIREAVHLHRASKERLERVARETERETRDSYLGVISEISRVQALGQSLKSNQTALKATEAGFEVGTRTTVDVLDARRNLIRAQTDYLRSRYDYLVNVIRLKLSAGTLTRKDVEEINGWLE